jgi:hypothetical protein
MRSIILKYLYFIVVMWITYMSRKFTSGFLLYSYRGYTRLQLMERISQPYGMLQSNNHLPFISRLHVNQVNHVITCHMHIDHIQSYPGHDQLGDQPKLRLNQKSFRRHAG